MYKSIVLRAGWSPITDRFYPMTALNKLVETFKQGPGEFKLDDSESFIGHYPMVNIERASHWTHELYLGNGGTELWARVRPLETPAGKLLSDYLRTGKASLTINMIGRVNQYNEVDGETVEFLNILALLTPTEDAKRKTR